LHTLEAALEAARAAQDADLLDPWKDLPSDSSRERKTFRKKVLSYYCGPDEDAAPCCMVTRLAAGGDKCVFAAHIWPFSRGGRGLERFGLSPQDANEARNGLLLLRTVEKAFDAKRAGFFCGAQSGPVFVVLDPALMEETVQGNCTFSQLTESELVMPEHAVAHRHYPRRRLLAWHFSQAMREAQSRGWRTPEWLTQYLQPSASDKVHAWLDGGSPQATWPGADAAGLALLRGAGTASSSSSSDEDNKGDTAA
jgi:hypothetical protein